MNLLLCFFFLACSNPSNSEQTPESEITVGAPIALVEEESAIANDSLVLASLTTLPEEKPVRTKLKTNLVATKVLGGKLKIDIPSEFSLMSRDMLEMKYPMQGNRPTEVYTNESGAINIAFNFTQNQATLDQLPQVKEGIRQQLQSPTIEFIEGKIQQINGRDFILFEFVSSAIDSKIYNLMFITSLENRLLMGTFNCTAAYRSEWEAKARNIVNSIQI